jgi:hypothetical protein
MAPTTANALRTELAGLITAIVPTTLGVAAEDRFKLYDNQRPFRDVMKDGVANSFRWFDLWWERPPEPPATTDGVIHRERYPFILEVAYPRVVYRSIKTPRAMLAAIDEDQNKLIQILRDEPTNATWMKAGASEDVVVDGEVVFLVMKALFELPRQLT